MISRLWLALKIRVCSPIACAADSTSAVTDALGANVGLISTATRIAPGTCFRSSSKSGGIADMATPTLCQQRTRTVHQTNSPGRWLSRHGGVLLLPLDEPAQNEKMKDPLN